MLNPLARRRFFGWSLPFPPRFAAAVGIGPTDVSHCHGLGIIEDTVGQNTVVPIATVRD
jgi:hypothetical protein